MNYNIYIRFPPAATFVVLDLSVYINATYIYTYLLLQFLLLYTHYTSTQGKILQKIVHTFLKIY